VSKIREHPETRTTHFFSCSIYCQSRSSSPR